MEVVDKNKTYSCSRYVKAKNFTQLMLCVLNNDLENAPHYLFEINAKNSIGWTALHIACRNSKTFSSEEMVDLLLRNGADPNAGANTETPLHLSSEYSNYGSSLETVEALIRSGADPNVKDGNGRTPLYLSSMHSNHTSSLETVELLLRSNADPNVKDGTGWTLLCMVSNNSKNSNSISSLATVKLLLRYHAEPFDKKTEKLKLELDNKSLRDEISSLKDRMLRVEKLLQEHFDCAPDGPLYIEAKNRFENKMY